MKKSFRNGNLQYFWGDFKEIGAFSTGFLEQMMEEARLRQKALRRIRLESIVDILVSAGKLWNDSSHYLRCRAMEYMPALTGFHRSMVEKALDAMASLLTRESLELKVERELGDPALLDRWSGTEGSGLSVMAGPLGTVLHVSAGNVFVGAVDSLVAGFLTKNVNILKCSGADPLFPMLFAQSLRDADSEGLLSGSFSILSFGSDDVDTTRFLKEHCDAIVVWGGREAVMAYRDDLPPGVRLIEHGPKYGFGVVTNRALTGGDPEALAGALALDVVMWESRACSSPQVIYIEGDSRAIMDFTSILGRELERLASSLPQGEPTFDEQIELLKARERAVFAEATGGGRLLCSRGSGDYTIIYEPSPSFSISPGNRCLYVKPYREWSEIREALRPFRTALQTVILACAPEERDSLLESLIGLGVTRITDAGSAHRSEIGAPHDGTFQLGELVRWVSQERASCIGGSGSEGEERLSRLLHFARENSPYYSRAFSGIEPLTVDRVPFLTKEEIYRNTPPEGTDLLTAPLAGAYAFASGGSTGAPKFGYYTYDEFDGIASMLREVYETAGVSSGDTVANLFFAGSLWTSFLAATMALGKIGCISLPIAGNAEMDLIVKYLSVFRPNVLIGSPSVLAQVAEACSDSIIPPLLVDRILYGGEHVSSSLHRFFEEKLAVKSVISAGYASVDGGVIGFQCRYCRGGAHHLFDRYQHLEIVDEDSGEPLPPGEEGEIVVTTLARRLMPVIRYRTGDRGRLTAGRCPCGRSEQLFELLGRCDDVVRVCAMNIHPGDIERFLQQDRGLSPQFQLRADEQGGRDRLSVLVEASDTESDGYAYRAIALRNRILSSNPELDLVIREGWLSSFIVEVVPPGALPRVKRTGKLKIVVDLRRRQ
jgi:phenylacetate-coenzyme A ligase PaaK-like adenylate-forming protein